MSVSGIAKELIDDREKTLSEDGERTYRRKFFVTVTSASDDANVVLGAAGLPQRYFPYVTSTSFDAKALCTSISASQVPQSPFHWYVTAEYSSKYEDQRDQQEDPLAEPPEIEWSFETIQVPIIGTPDQNVTIAGSTAPITGSIKTPAGEVINPPPMMDESRPVVTITRNESQFNVNSAVLYQNAINSDTFFGVPPRCAKMRGISARWVSSKGTSYWQVTYTIAFKRDTWDLQLLNYGSLALFSATDRTPSQIFTLPTTDGLVYPCMGFLNTNGTQRDSTSTPTFSIYRIHKEQPFSSLNLPLSPNRT